MSATKLHTHTKQQANLYFFYMLIFNFWIATWKTNDHDNVGKIRDRMQRTDIGKYSFVNRTIRTGSNYLQVVRNFPLQTETF